MKKVPVEICDSCENPIWNPDWWNETGMCGPCTTGESAELFHDLWEPPYIGDVDTDEKFMAYWQKWYREVYLPATT